MDAAPFFQLRWLLWTLGAALVAHVMITRSRRRKWAALPALNSHAIHALALLYFILATLAKWSQLRAGALNAQDFWLFEDMLRHMAQGEFFLTRFGPQAQQVIQHGIVHPMLSFALLAPLAKVLGATPTAVLFEPAIFALAALSLARLAARKWGEGPAFWIALSFLTSTQVGRVLMYDVHPEAAYPLAVFLWAEAITAKKPRAWAIAAASFFLAGIKEDAVLVLPPLIAAAAVALSIPKKILALSLACAVAVALTQMGLVHHWKTVSEFIPVGAGVVGGAHWDSPASLAQMLQHLAPNLTTLLGALPTAIASRPFLSLLILAPFVAGQTFFWIAILPLTWACALLGEPMKFVTYYAAPFIGIFWLCAALFPPRALNASKWLLAMVIASLLLGDGGPKYFAPSLAQREAHVALSTQSWLGQGWVPAVFLGEVPRENVLTDRDPFDTPFE